ncbi:unnamed protein product [Effrenium voratum]|nr:unnamed protein product [Effrenium voratum]
MWVLVAALQMQRLVGDSIAESGESVTISQLGPESLAVLSSMGSSLVAPDLTLGRLDVYAKPAAP